MDTSIDPLRQCSECLRLYSFIRCRYTLSHKNGVMNICLECVPKVKKRLRSYPLPEKKEAEWVW